MPSRRRRGTQFTALLLLLALVSTACGARLSEEQREAAIAANFRGGSGGGGDLGEGGFGDVGGGSSGDGTGGAGGTNGGSTGRTGGSGGGEGPGGGDGPGGRAPGGQRAGATDTGVTAQDITIAVLADISGVQPGLFQSAWDGAKAARDYINSRGGIHGRAVKLLLLDSRTDSGGNRAAMLEACQKAFAVVGSMSAFDDGSAKPGEECGIPDMSAIVVNAPKFRAKNVYPTFPNSPEHIAVGNAAYIAKRFPNEVKRSGLLYLDQAVTRANALRRRDAWQAVGYEFVYEQAVQVLEADYTRFVIEMQRDNVQYVTMVANFENIARLQKAMKKQGYFPKVRDWDSVAYDPAYISESEGSADGSFIFVNTNLFEEAGSIPEMQQYLQWVRRSAPGSDPDYFGIYAWSSFRLFQKLADEIGPQLTRKKLLAALQNTGTWDGNGIHAPHQIGKKLPSVCFIHLQVTDGRFKRLHPGQGQDCSGRLQRLENSHE